VDAFQTRLFAMLKELQARKQQLDRVIAALELLDVGSTGAEPPKKTKGTAARRGDANG